VHSEVQFTHTNECTYIFIYII